VPAIRARQDSVLAVLHAVLAQGATQPTYSELGAITGRSVRTITNAVGTLRGEGYLYTTPLRMGAALGLVLSVALGAESCRAGIVDADGALHAEIELTPQPNQAALEPDLLLARIARAVHDVLDRAREMPELHVDGRLPLIGVATAWPGPIRGSKRTAGSVLNPAWLTNSAETLPEAVARALGCLPKFVHALNDANAHALATAFDLTRSRAGENDGKADKIALAMRIGGGLGAATIIIARHQQARLSFIDSTMLGGARSLAGEIGHLPIEPSVVKQLNDRARWVDGLAPLSLDWRCSCGQRGHLEALASGTAWTHRMEASGVQMTPLLEGLRRNATSQTDKVLADLEDQRVVIALEDAGRLIGRSLAAPVLLLDPQWLTLTGSFAVQPVLDGIMAERETWRHVFGDALHISIASGPWAKYIGVRGAALAVLRAKVYRTLSAERLAQPIAGAEIVTFEGTRG
jgi:predicted NBD/HSP70 family sugar kinase